MKNQAVGCAFLFCPFSFWEIFAKHIPLKPLTIFSLSPIKDYSPDPAAPLLFIPTLLRIYYLRPAKVLCPKTVQIISNLPGRDSGSHPIVILKCNTGAASGGRGFEFRPVRKKTKRLQVAVLEGVFSSQIFTSF